MLIGCCICSRSPRKSDDVDDGEDEAKESDADVDVEKLKLEASRKKAVVALEPVNKSSDKVRMSRTAFSTVYIRGQCYNFRIFFLAANSGQSKL
jgi:hypothetical protein